MRYEDWEKRLNDYLETVGPFEWGTNDCCLFAANAVMAMTGEDYAKDYRGKYKTYKGALLQLKKMDLEWVDSLAAQTLGNSKPPAFAQRGDVVAVKTGDEIALGICIGAKIAAVGQDGLVMLPMSQAIQAWSV